MMRGLQILAAVMALAAPAAAAEHGQRPASPSPFPSANQNKGQPIQIEAATLEVRDKSRIATFSGNVQVVQGDTTMRCKTLVVYYGPDEAAAGRLAASGAPKPGSSPSTVIPQDAHDIRRIEAHGDVTVVTKDQNASGDLGVYDVRFNTITLTGNVVVSQGKNVVRGDRVVVDTTTGYSRVESTPTAPSRVRALIIPNKGSDGTTSNIMTLEPGRPN